MNDEILEIKAQIFFLQEELTKVKLELANHKEAIEYISTCHMTPVVRQTLKEILNGKRIAWSR